MKNMTRLIAIWLLTLLLISCVPTTESTNESESPVDQTLADVTPTQAPNLPATPEPTATAPEGQSEAIIAPAPEETVDRSIRLTPRALPPRIEPVPQVTPATPVVEPIPEDILNQLLADLPNHTTRDTDEYELIRAEAVIWNDGSLGCPQPGVNYTQALVEGYWVIFQIGDETFDYRVRQNGTFFLCDPRVKP